MQLTVKETIEKIQEQAKINAARDKEQKVKTVPLMKVGEVIRQGDIYIHKVADNHPVGEQLDRRQLADGHSIGQRHMLLGEFKIYEGVELPSWVDKSTNQRLGYAFDVTGECRNSHPEHDHYLFLEDRKGRYQVTYQLDMQTLRKVSD